MKTTLNQEQIAEATARFPDAPFEGEGHDIAAYMETARQRQRTLIQSLSTTEQADAIHQELRELASLVTLLGHREIEVANQTPAC